MKIYYKFNSNHFALYALSYNIQINEILISKE